MNCIGVVLDEIWRTRIQIYEYSNTQNYVHIEIQKRIVPFKAFMLRFRYFFLSVCYLADKN
jgi:hypothetical protein